MIMICIKNMKKKYDGGDGLNLAKHSINDF